MTPETGAARRWLDGLLFAASRSAPARAALLATRRLLLRRRVHERRPPFDLELGIDASGSEPAHWLGTAPSGAAPDRLGYLGLAPSALRAAIGEIPDPPARHFVDLGCGKGRALAAASERPFRGITGIELSPDLARVARRNAARVRATHPGRTPIVVREGDATSGDLPDGPLALYFYNPFGEASVARLAAALSDRAARQDLMILYVNPVHAHVFDAAPAFRRSAALSLPIDEADRPYTRGDHEILVIWRSAGTTEPPRADAGRRLVVTEPNLRVEFG